MRRSLVWSAALHLLVLVLAVVGLPRLWDSAPPTDAPPMIVEMVNIDQQTTAKDTPKKKPKKKKKAKKTPPPPKAKPRTADLPPAPPRIKAASRPDTEKVPLIKPAKPKKVKKKKKKKPVARPPSPPRAIARARPKRRPMVAKEDFLQSVLRDVAPEERSEKPKEKPKKRPEPQPEPKKTVQNRASLDAVATISEIDAIRHRIQQCWVIPAGALEADKLVVSIRVWVNPDGTVREARILDQSRMLKDVFFRTAAESARRAVLNPRCSPLPIPPKKYDQFKEFVLDFNPKEAAGT
jgi:hypothetical protein